MKLAVIGTKGLPATYGGVEKLVERLSIEQIKLGVEVTVFSRFYYSRVKQKKFIYKGIKVINIKGLVGKRLDVITHSFISSIIAAIGEYDIIAFHSTVPGFFCVLPKLLGKKVFIHNHGLELLSYKWNILDKIIMRLLIKSTSYFSDGVSTVSISQLELCKKYYKKDVTLLRNGLDLVESKTYDEIKGGKYILFVGRIVQDKGIEILIEAFNQNVFSKNDLELLIVGNYQPGEKYFKYLQSLSVQNEKIKFIGPRYGLELIKLYQDAYCTVIPSKVESFSYVLYEALFYNGCVICSDIEEFKLSVKGYVEFFNNSSSQDLYLKLLKILTNQDLRDKMIKNAKKFPFENNSWKIVSQKYIKLYKSK